MCGAWAYGKRKKELIGNKCRFLGIKLDSIAMQARLPAEKLTRGEAIQNSCVYFA